MNNPKLLPIAFANSGLKNPIEINTPPTERSATLDAGFPESTMKPISEGGLPPSGKDLNGILYDISDNVSFLSKGGQYKFDAPYATQIGGYQVGAKLLLDDGSSVVSTIPNNMNNPNTNMLGWDLSIKDAWIKTWSGRTQESKNKDFLSSKDFGLVPNSTEDQFSKMQNFLTQGGNLTLEKGTYYMGSSPSDIYIASNTTLNAYGAILNYSDASNTSNGRIRVDGTVVLSSTTLVEDALIATNTIRVASTAGIVKGMCLYLKSEQIWSSDCKYAEIVRVINVIGDTIYLSTDLFATYQASQTTVEVHDVKYNVHINGLGMYGSGKVAGSAGKVDRAFHYNHVCDCTLNFAFVANFDRMGVMIGNAYNSFVRSSTVALTKIDAGNNYIQYGIAIFDALNGGCVEDCIVAQGRHGIVYTTYSGYGYSVNHTVERNIVTDTHASGIATHKTNANGFIKGNKMVNCWGGIDCRIPNATIIDNAIINPINYGFVLRSNFSGLKILGANYVTNSFNAIYTTELEGDIVGVDIQGLEILTSRNSGMSIVVPAGVTLNNLKIAHVNIDAAAGEGIAITGASNVTITDLVTTNQPSNRYAVRFTGADTAVVSDCVTNGRVSRMEANGSVNCTNIRVVNNSFVGDYVAASAATGNAVGLFTSGNKRMDINRSKNIVGGVLSVSEGLGYASVFVSTGVTDTCSTISTAIPTGEILTLTKAGSGTLVFNATGNIILKAGTVTITSNSVVIRFLWNGANWLEM